MLVLDSHQTKRYDPIHLALKRKRRFLRKLSVEWIPTNIQFSAEQDLLFLLMLNNFYQFPMDLEEDHLSS